MGIVVNRLVSMRGFLFLKDVKKSAVFREWSCLNSKNSCCIPTNTGNKSHNCSCSNNVAIQQPNEVLVAAHGATREDSILESAIGFAPESLGDKP